METEKLLIISDKETFLVRGLKVKLNSGSYVGISRTIDGTSCVFPAVGWSGCKPD